MHAAGRGWWLALACLLCSAPVQARRLEMKAATLDVAGVAAQQLQVRMQWPDGGGEGQMEVSAARLQAPDLGLDYRALHWRCRLRRQPGDGWRCDGPLLAAGQAAPLLLDVAWSAAATDAHVSRGASRVGISRLAATPEHTRIELAAVPLAWLQPLLQRLWAEGRAQGGSLDARLQLKIPHQGWSLDGRVQAHGMGFDNATGDIAAQGVDLALDLALSKSAQGTDFSASGQLAHGEGLFGTAYVQWPDTPAQFTVQVHDRGDGMQIPLLRWDDARALSLHGALALGRAGALEELTLEARSDDLATLPKRYLSGWLGVSGLPQLQLRGAARVSVQLDRDGLAAASAELDAVDADDAAAHFGLHGLDGAVRYSALDATESELTWQGGRVYDIAFGAGQLPLVSASGVLQATAPVTLPLLGGRLHLDGLQVRPPRGPRGTEFDLALGVADVQMPELTRALGWPAFRGTLSGNVPSVRYRSPLLSFDGGLSAEVFDGRVAVDGLQLEHPFGAHPTLAANVRLQGLDLLHLTEVFGFGSMQGRLDGSIRDLQLLDWQPQRFDAELHTVPVRGVAQRISQRAVQDLSSLGGGLGGGMQALFLGLFEDFGYRQIGLSCQLRGSVCRMDGLRPAGTGFLIVEGSGVPRLDVVGFNRMVDWPTLLQRISEVASGESAPRIE